MFCNWCGGELAGFARFCSKCGERVETPANAPSPPAFTPPLLTIPYAPPASLMKVQATPNPELARIRSEYPDLVGIGGWLLWFCVVVTIISPAIAIVTAIIDLQSDSDPVSALVALVTFGFVAFSIFAGINIWRISFHGLTLARILLVVNFCIGFLSFIVQMLVRVAQIEDGLPSQTSLSFASAAGLRGIVWSVAWFLYFRHSIRVKATFGRNL